MDRDVRNEDEEDRRLAIEEAKAFFAAQAAEDAAKGIVRKWDGTNGMTTAEVLAMFREMDEQAGGKK